jgi:DNA topoisomerase II
MLRTPSQIARRKRCRISPRIGFITGISQSSPTSIRSRDSARLCNYIKRVPFPSFDQKSFSTSAVESPSELTIEEQFSRKTPLEHILLRPGMYVGPAQQLSPSPCWVLDDTPLKPSEKQAEKRSTLRMMRKDYGLTPALIKVFDEILVNASDNRLRDPKGCKHIDVVIDPGGEEKKPLITIRNDGKGIPVEIHKGEMIYLPEMLFGLLLTGSNFDDTQKRVTGGRHGYGAKLTNIFSREFTVETQDQHRGLCYQQTWKNNMSESSEPKITKQKGKDYTAISFVPDMPRLTGVSNKVAINPEDYALMCRRVVDIAGCAAGELTVTLNGNDVSVKSFETYANMYRENNALPLVYQKVNPRWEVAVGLSDTASFDGISFVNGMMTSRGGTHVNSIVQQVAKAIFDKAVKMNPEFKNVLTTILIRRHLFIACNAFIENPTFDNQMKESLTSNPSDWGSECNLNRRFLHQLVVAEEDGGPGIVEEVVKIALSRQRASLVKEVGGASKSKRQLLNVHKLEDAHLAGTAKSIGCTLILTEGDSAKALAVAGLEIIGRKTFGVFPLRGKFLNVREASVAQITKNAEAKALCSIIGLDFSKKYTTLSERAELRYGHVMLMTDQDTDGSHIKGLIMNFFRYFWPSLLKPPVDQPQSESFLSSFITPLLKVKGKDKKEVISFYSMAEYNEWRASLHNETDIKKWDIKYYKGLGTSTPTEAKDYFSAFKNHIRPFSWRSEMDGELLDMLFDKQRAADRRAWILDKYDENSFVVADSRNNNSVSFEDFVNHEMIHYSNADNIRSLPSAIDGLKPSQRKVLYACFKRRLNSEVKVAQLTGYCAEHTAYHHGEMSLQNTSKFCKSLSII